MIDVQTIATTSLGDRSYLAHDGRVALVVDPQRDIDRVLALADELGVRITHVAETHIHNDYVTGGLELAGRTGAAYLVDARDDVGFDRTPVREGDDIVVGAMRLRPLATPGHTHHHLSYALTETQASGSGAVTAVFTGGSMLYGTTGRTDLVSPADTVELTHAQYHSVRRLVDELPGAAVVYPTHGFGSFCSATPPSGEASTVGDQRTVNPALIQGEQEFVDTLIAGLGAYPAYYARMAPTNAAGPAPVDLSAPEPVGPVELRARLEAGIAAGQWVVDLRERTAFAAGHLVGSLSFQLAQPFVTYLGWLLPEDAELTLIGETGEQVADARRELVRIGIDRLVGAATGPLETLSDDAPLASYQVSDFPGLLARDPEAVNVVDARTENERAGGGVAGSLHIPLHEMLTRRHEVPDGEVWIYCGSGYRASVAASLLAAEPGRARELIVINDDWPHATEAGLTIAHDQAPALAR
ncbi:MBL fold metallo-hydrolase [Actinomycetospora chibensis]|uniref:Rhodanese-like domain-containing protein n=1 Tax=Actinomycetospora chibensis TaxID=663606 RepID=A0ABV9RLA3_9PSEU|nr:rhodanese-like domain-containing protein [Actinomycetospora chibensis]MDD7922765.1 MBL fold metallo-hydrolase [Actinomycetospora chibensis]